MSSEEFIRPPGLSDAQFQAVKVAFDSLHTEGGALAGLIGEKFGVHPEVLEAISAPQWLSYLFEATQGDKSRIGISVQAILAWEEHRASLLPTIARNLTSRASLAGLEAVRDRQSEIILEKITELSLGLDEFRLSVSQELVALKSQPSGIPEQSFTPVLKRVESINRKLMDADARRAQAQTARHAREVEQAKAKALKLEQEAAAREKKRAKTEEEKLKKKELLEARKKRAREVKEAKSRGVNPYTPEETLAFAKRLEAKGKIYYTPEQRAKFKKGNPPKKGSVSGKDGKKVTGSKAKGKNPAAKFRVFTPEQKQAFIDSFTKKGKRYYTKAERMRFKSTGKKAEDLGPAPSGLQPSMFGAMAPVFGEGSGD